MRRILLDPEKLREAARLRGVRQVDLARAAGVTQGSISYLFAAPRNPSAKVCVRIARHLGVDVEDLLGEYDTEASHPGTDLDIDTATRFARGQGLRVSDVVKA